ncbi:SDR family NAD(P)-dependent oxidoreductase [Herbiconiux ginsengi]|uniref:Short-chain dehydrogenase n=1 Tax=Herbiconiux ginsengi TaxID=381665 RepID=A0A1H3LMC0_9MICO|nr:SDR family NAD(P)-dependent oxidoreductase [Herbiconiux ginsengi]SDY65450.1 Short-chain dehydrogenase [Herbiconiux ginsengi]
MAHILVTGSTDGLGRASAESLLAQGHTVTLHARSRARAAAVSPLLERGAGLIVADLSNRNEVVEAVDQMNAGASLDAVIHNAGVISGAAVLPVNVVAPYLFTALLRTPTRHVYLSSSMHRGGRADLTGLDWTSGRATASYSDSKLLVTTLAAAIADRWAPNVVANSVDPGWVPTKMGGASAPDDFDLGHRTQDILATDAKSAISGGYWHHGRQERAAAAVTDPAFQAALLTALAITTNVELPHR